MNTCGKNDSEHLEFEGSFQQFVYELKRNEKLRNVVTILFVVLLLIILYECYFHRSKA
jgi:hypothetical protein